MNSIKNALRNSEFDPSLVGTPERKIIGEMIGAAEDSMRRAEIDLTTTPAKFGLDGAQLKAGVDALKKPTDIMKKDLKDLDNQ